MKILFLDIDGVLNIMSNSYRTFMKPYGQHIEPHLVQRLNYIIDKTDVHIVVSSSWRHDMDDLKKQLQEQGFNYLGHILDRTPFSGEMDMNGEESGLRGNQIQQWLKDAEFVIDAYCVLEDEVSDICGSKCRAIGARYVVEIDMAEGLSQNDVDRTLYILGDTNEN